MLFAAKRKKSTEGRSYPRIFETGILLGYSSLCAVRTRQPSPEHFLNVPKSVQILHLLQPFQNSNAFSFLNRPLEYECSRSRSISFQPVFVERNTVVRDSFPPRCQQQMAPIRDQWQSSRVQRRKHAAIRLRCPIFSNSRESSSTLQGSHRDSIAHLR